MSRCRRPRRPALLRTGRRRGPARPAGLGPRTGIPAGHPASPPWAGGAAVPAAGWPPGPAPRLTGVAGWAGGAADSARSVGRSPWLTGAPGWVGGPAGSAGSVRRDTRRSPGSPPCPVAPGSPVPGWPAPGSPAPGSPAPGGAAALAGSWGPELTRLHHQPELDWRAGPEPGAAGSAGPPWPTAESAGSSGPWPASWREPSSGAGSCGSPPGAGVAAKPRSILDVTCRPRGAS